jgi:hypothetical protein
MKNVQTIGRSSICFPTDAMRACRSTVGTNRTVWFASS